MNQDDQVEALEAARRAGIDLDLLDSNLALSHEQRWSRHHEALKVVRAYEKKTGHALPESAILRRTRLGIELLLKVNNRYEVQGLL